jgi:OmpA-OmpF porin, OOP family
MKVLSIAVLCALTTPALADADKGFIFGIGAGRTTVEAKTDLLEFDADATGYKVFAGWRFNPYLALEASHIDSSTAKQSYFDGAAQLSVEGELIQASIVGTWPVHEYWNLYGRVGTNWYEADGRVKIGDTVFALEDEGTEFGWGTGVSATWDRALFRLEYEKVPDQNFDLVSLSIAWQL